MKRTRFAAMVTAAVIGSVGGIVAAVVGHDTDGTPSAGALPEPVERESTDPEPSAAPNEPLLYYSGGLLHDGDETLAFDSAGSLAARLRLELPTTLTRREGGYLIAVPSELSGAEDLWSVDRGGAETLVGSVAEGWDLDLSAARVVGHDGELDLLTVWDSVSGEPVARWDRGFGSADSAAFAGDEDSVLVSKRVNSSSYRLVRWDVAASTSASQGLVGFADMAVSPGGHSVAGRVGTDGAGSDVDARCLALHETYLGEDVAWQTCDYAPPGVGRAQFSPDGSRVLTAPLPFDGAGPSELVAIDVAAGPGESLARFDTRDVTFASTWADNDSVYLTGADYGADSSSYWVEQCDLQGSCTELVPAEPGEIVLGEVR